MSTNSDELCIICYEPLTELGGYVLPECNHRFHQSCINQWFRQGHSKCPLCNSTGIAGEMGWHERSFQRGMEQFKLLRAASRKTGASKKLVSAIKSIKKKEDKIKALKEQIKQWQTADIILDGEKMTVKEAVKKWRKISGGYRTKLWQLRRAKRALPAKLNMIPVILVEKRIIN